MQITDVKSLESGSVKEEKLKKYQELEKLKKELETIEGKLETVSEKKREGYFRRAAFAEKR